MSIDHDAIRARVRARIDADEDMSMRSVSLQAFGRDSALHKFLTGANETIRLSNLSNLADALGVSLSWLLFERELETDPPGAEEAPINEDALDEMVSNALEEIQPGMTLGEIRPAVASSLHEQLRLHLAGAGVVDFWAEKLARGKGARSPAPTKRDEPGASRTS